MKVIISLGLRMMDCSWMILSGFVSKVNMEKVLVFIQNGCVENTPAEDYTKWFIPEIPKKVEGLKQNTVVLENNSKIKFLKTTSNRFKLISILKKKEATYEN